MTLLTMVPWIGIALELLERSANTHVTNSTPQVLRHQWRHVKLLAGLRLQQSFAKVSQYVICKFSIIGTFYKISNIYVNYDFSLR